jgi:uncharacterized protein (DUF488 family)
MITNMASCELPGIWTVGHSTRTADDFVNILEAHQIERLVDVRSFPGSRRYPQFSKNNLSSCLHERNINYHHLPSLGGRRQPRKDSDNTAWKNLSFRAYADYMESDEFRKGIKELLELARESRTAIMCAEAVWWRCHRSLIADYLKANGALVIHIIDAGRTEQHPYTNAARIVDGELSYRGLLGQES